MSLSDAIKALTEELAARFLLDALFPGVILPFSGTFGGSDGKRPIDSRTGKARESWALCDGTNGTPDLRGKFLRGKADGETSGASGGTAPENVDAEGWNYALKARSGKSAVQVQAGAPQYIAFCYIKKIA